MNFILDHIYAHVLVTKVDYELEFSGGPTSAVHGIRPCVCICGAGWERGVRGRGVICGRSSEVGNANRRARKRSLRCIK